ncbi:MAG: hypothetical protein WBQ78_10760 [Gammaproteobacteria bacterium]
MKKRYLYSILFGIPGLAASLLITFAIFGALAGFMWIYVYGDNPWPPSTGTILPAFFMLIFLALWISSIIAGFITGKRFEESLDLDRNHIWVSVDATALPITLIILHQFGIGNIGPKSDSRLCSEFCSGKGYAASGIPPKDSGERTCICLDSAGQAAITESMGSELFDSM